MDAIYSEPGWTPTRKVSKLTRRSTSLEGLIREPHGESDDDDDTTEDDGEDGSEDGSEDVDEYVDEDELANIHIGMKRKAASTTRSGFPTKVAKTMTLVGPSNTARRVVDDHHRAELTLIDAPVDEDVLVHPYGRHSCLYMEVKLDANKKPNPLEAVRVLSFEVPYY